MKHLLLVAYGFPPANNMAAQRNWLRVKGLDELGYRVSVVTRPWNPLQGIGDASEESPGGISVETMLARTKVYRVPFGPNAPGGLNPVLRRLAGGRGLAARNLAFFLCPVDAELRLHVDIEALARLLDSPPDVVFASGAPWSNFELGRALARRFRAKYVAEYRDMWGYLDESLKLEGNNSYNDNVVSQLKRRYALSRERAFNGGADLLVSVSEPILENAKRITGVRRGLVINNGYDPAELAKVEPERYDRFTLSYIGTIYNTQRAEAFFKALELFIDRNRIPLDGVRVRMVGSRTSHGFERTLERIAACRHHASVVEVTDRADRETSLRAQKSSAVVLYFAHAAGSQGIYSGKIFEYLASGTPILFCPSDHGVVEELLKQTRAGTTCDSIEEIVRFLESAYASWKATGKVSYDPDLEAIRKYSYLELNRKLVEGIDSL